LQRVLLIDDSPVQLRAREAVLRDAGFEVDVATTAESALTLLRGVLSSGLGAVITDHVLPGASGVAFVRQLRALHPRVPVIVITGLPHAEEEYAGLDIVFREKPCPPLELIALLRSCIGDQAA
jgi:DNA-binding response OmpR family regulator